MHGPSSVFRSMDFPEFAINQELHLRLQLIISEILGHHNQGLPRNLHFKFFLLIDLLKEHSILWRFYINITSCAGLRLESVTEFQCQGTDTFGSICV